MNRAIHAAKREAKPRAGQRANPDLWFDEDGEMYPMNHDGEVADSIGNISDWLD